MVQLVQLGVQQSAQVLLLLLSPATPRTGLVKLLVQPHSLPLHYDRFESLDDCLECLSDPPRHFNCVALDVCLPEALCPVGETYRTSEKVRRGCQFPVESSELN